MIGFEQAAWFWLVVPGLLAWWAFVRVQRRALTWLETRVAARFRRPFSVYGRRSLAFHMVLLLVMGLALVMAGTGPFVAGKAETASATGRLLFVVDASASMYANDVVPLGLESDSEMSDPPRRIELARGIVGGLMRELQGFRFALATFSGRSAIHLPMTSNASLLEETLRALEIHSYYRNTGSSLANALDVVPHFVDRRGYRLQVVILSDGEQPRPEDYRAALAALAEQGVPVHSVAIGSLEGQARRILDFQDVLDKKENPRALVEYETRRVDEHLERISARTSGSFFVARPGVVERLAERIVEAGGDLEPFEHDAARSDLSGRYLLIFLFGFLLDALWFGRKPRFARDSFDLSRLGEARERSARVRRPSRSAVASGQTRSRPGARRGAAGVWLGALPLAALLIHACALPFGDGNRGSARKQAHRENESGISQDELGRHRAARTHYERSRAFGIEPQVPAHNLARSVLIAGDYSEAHDLFQEALLLDPDLPEGHFNDGMTLYGWGLAERDPQNCDLERTLELWLQAERRFSSALEAASKTSGGDDDARAVADDARDNREALRALIEEVEGLIAQPPDECLGGGGSDQESPSGGGGGEDEESEAGGSGGSPEDEESEGGEPPPPPEGDDDGEGEGEGDEESEGGSGAGGGEDQREGEAAGGGGLTADELEEIGQRLEALAQQGREAGKYHRRTLPEQFRKEDWSNPDATIWW